MALPELCSLLDPREEADAKHQPIEDSVNIPFRQLPTRLHELPDKSEPTRVAGPPALAQETIDWLRSGGRAAKVAQGFAYASTPKPLGRLWRPNDFLMTVAESLLPGRALDLGCGTGRDAIAMACLGWQVTAIDHLPEAVERGLHLAQRYGVAGQIRWLCADLREGVTGSYDLIASLFYFDSGVLAQTQESLAVGGSLVVEAFAPEHRARHNKPSSEQVVSEETLRLLLPAVAVISCERHITETKETLRAWLRKLAAN